jgi:hypothetical protein
MRGHADVRSPEKCRKMNRYRESRRVPALSMLAFLTNRPRFESYSAHHLFHDLSGLRSVVRFLPHEH